jgi:hypothetical protein
MRIISFFLACWWHCHQISKRKKAAHAPSSGPEQPDRPGMILTSRSPVNPATGTVDQQKPTDSCRFLRLNAESLTYATCDFECFR